jgi:Fem-1 family protein b
MALNDESTNKFDNLLLSAAHQGDVTLLQTYLSTVEDANMYLNRVYNDLNEQKRSLLMIACINGFEDMVSMLLNFFKPDCEVLNAIKITLKYKTVHMYEDVTVLWAATVVNNFNIVKLLVEHGAKVNHTTRTNSTPIRCACSHGNIDMVRYLIENGADIHIAKICNQTNLLLSVAREHMELVTYLVNELGCDVNECNSHGRSPLTLAADRGSLELVQFLLDHGARNVRLSFDHMSPLMLAAEKRRTDVVNAISSHCTLLEQIEGEELLGSAFTCTELGDSDYEQSYEHYSRALELRSIHNFPKPLKQSTDAIFNHRQECQTIHQLNELRSNPHELYIEALLIRERLLGPTNAKYRRSLWYCGVALIRLRKYHEALDFWMYEVDLRRQYSIPLNTRKLRPFAKIFAKIVTKSVSLPIQTVCKVLTVIIDELEHNSKEFNDNMHTLLFIITVTSQVYYDFEYELFFFSFVDFYVVHSRIKCFG